MTEASIDLTALLGKLDEQASATLAKKPDVTDADDNFSADDIPGAASARWAKITDVVVVVCDLKSSTRLGVKKHATSTARIYKSGVEGAVKILHDFEADYIDIQGDGGFGVFWGEKRYERALCAAVTIRTFSDSWVETLNAKWPESLPETGYKVGIASGSVLVKRLGTRNEVEETEAVWAGKPVNYAAKCGQAANVGQIIATNRVWDRLAANNYVAYSCGCSGSQPKPLWEDFSVETLPDGAHDAVVLKSAWCPNCGPSFCDAILAGKKKRQDVNEALHAKEMTQMRAALSIQQRQARHQHYLA